MQRILIAGKTKQVCESIASLLSEEEYSTFSLTDGIRMRSIDAEDFDTIIISTPLEDEFGLDLAAELHGKTSASLIVLTKGELAEEVQAKIRFTGAFVIGRPCSKASLIQAIKFAEVAGESLKRLTEEKIRLEQQIEDIKLINKAKTCLMEYLKLTEEQAHRQIQKQAMDLRKTQKQVAQDILIMYSLS
ncbi:MAG: ANTAR domain-containing protein [Firmicutes bacterium]|nr:ANTAR domain-containing protein [[Eubacterium] siraeum]MCM1488918.1 ANTAR domain-containing protein [Bacillota bacterium]